MKIIIVCLMAILTGACRQAIDSSTSRNSDSTMKRNDKLSKVMDDYSKIGNPYYMRHEYEFRGPLTVAQVEEDLIESHKESLKIREKVYGVTERFEDTEAGKIWGRLKSEYRDGDELYFYLATAKPSWSQSWGYVLIREKKKVVTKIMTAMN